MGDLSRARQRPGPAPTSVNEVLRRPGRPLRRSLEGRSEDRPSSGRPAAPRAASGYLRVSASDTSHEAEAERLAGPVAGGAELPSHLAWDFSRVRIHTDSRASTSAREVGARAYTVGTDIVFAEGQYQPATPAGRRLLAHELVHVAQGAASSADLLHRFEAPEHQDFGDRGIVDLAAFLQTREGAEFGEKLGGTTALQDLRSDPFFQGKKFRVHDVELTVGDIIAMAGDFYPSPADLVNADPAELREIRDAIREEREGKLAGGKANERYQKITLKYIAAGKRSRESTFIGMAKVNAPHFTPTNRGAWKDLHKQALEAARAAGKDTSKQDAALLIDTFGGHFLTDAFASGHLFDKQKLEVEIELWLTKNKVSPPNPEMAVYYAAIGANTTQLVLKNIHDRLNAEGIEVSNRRGMKWKAFGDDYLKNAAESLRIGAWAVFESRRQVMEANRAGPEARRSNDDARSDEVLELLPDQASVDRATAKAVSYIPWAVQSLTPLIYRQRGAGALELKQRLGVAGSVLAPVIKANIAAIADPGRENQLRQLEEEKRRREAGPLLAPQFTVWDF
ncbi:MAG: eCIS core domain-containing protein [Pseudonocardiaceae bacterium]